MKQLPEIKLDYNDPFIRRLAKRIIFLDIETSLNATRVFGTGNHYITQAMLRNNTRILTIAYASLYDLVHKGEKAVKVLSNRKSSTFKKDPLDDEEILEKIWYVLDDAEVIVAHNVKFDRGWIMGRFVGMQVQLPSPFFSFCTYLNLKNYNFTSKKLDALAKEIAGTKKIKTDLDLWNRCSDGDSKAFREMEIYNVGDVHDTLFKLWKLTAYYNPVKAIDFTNPDSEYIQCRVDGRYLVEDGTWRNRSTGLVYNQYLNPRSGQKYRDRRNITAKNSGEGLVKPIIS